MVVRLSGDVDLAGVPRLRAALVELDRRGHHCIELDLSLVDFLDSSGLGALLGALRRARAGGGDLHVVAAATPVTAVLGILGLNAVFGLPPDPAHGPAAGS